MNVVTDADTGAPAEMRRLFEAQRRAFLAEMNPRPRDPARPPGAAGARGRDA